MQVFKQLSEKEVMKQDSILLQPILNNVQSSINEIALKYGYTYILNTDLTAQNGTPMMLYANKESDITELVLTAYRLKKNK
jgi:Skp family chaperone for outer membrane proteins